MIRQWSGAYGKDDDKGAAYVFVRSGTSWTQQAKLTASDSRGWRRFRLFRSHQR